MSLEQSSSAMTSHERRSVLSLCLLYVTRMLGLFMVLPVFAIYLKAYEGYSLETLGIALGVYGLTQALFQLPFGLLSDKLGRKPLIILGLLVFIAGSITAALADSLTGIIIGRALQGGGAIASTIMAFVADVTREESRSKAMAMIGASIGLSFAIAMFTGPKVAGVYGLAGIFWLTAGLATLGVVLVLFAVPTPKQISHSDALPVKAMLLRVLTDRQLLRYDFGIFSLHMALTAMFVVSPSLLRTVMHLEPETHGFAYLAILGGAFVSMLPIMIAAETRNKSRLAFLAAVATMALASLSLSMYYTSPMIFIGACFAFFTGFNLLEAMLPSLLSRQVFPGGKGTAMGIYSTSQFLGIACGGAAGGWLADHYGVHGLFMFIAVVLLAWFVVAFGMVAPKKAKTLVLNYGFDISPKDLVVEIDKMLGVIDITVLEDQAVAYIKVEAKNFDEAQLARFSTENS